jgi:hypothetical protein
MNCYVNHPCIFEFAKCNMVRGSSSSFIEPPVHAALQLCAQEGIVNLQHDITSQHSRFMSKCSRKMCNIASWCYLVSLVFSVLSTATFCTNPKTAKSPQQHSTQDGIQTPAGTHQSGCHGTSNTSCTIRLRQPHTLAGRSATANSCDSTVDSLLARRR